MRRSAIRRNSAGIPLDRDRCDHPVERVGELFTDRCRRARKRGYLYCAQHLLVTHLHDNYDTG